MKINISAFSTLKTSALGFLLLMLSTLPLPAQSSNTVEDYLKSLPKNLKLKENKPQKYHITADYFNGDIFGNFINKNRVIAEYTRGFANGSVKWSNVKLAEGSTRNGPFENAVAADYMENFSYLPSSEMLQASSFSSFPPNSIHTKNLVWDMLAIEGFAWNSFDSLQLNQPYKAASFNGEVELGGVGTFENRDIRITWIGISMMNKEICAVIDFRTFDNPFSVETEQLKIKGRSHYWGKIWVSLADKQIEHAVLYEDVVMDMTMGNQINNQLMNTTREIIIEKVN